MNKLSTISLWLYALLLSVCLVACSSDEAYDDVVIDEEEVQHDSEMGSHMLLQLSFLSQSGTRANPTGGETGDGTEPGVRHENEIKNVCVFIIRNVNGMDADASTPFLFNGYFTTGMVDCNWLNTTYGVDIKFKLKGYTPADNDRVLVIANVGNILSSVSNLGQLRDYTAYSAWQNQAHLADNNFFVMSSAYNNSSDGLVHVTPHPGTFEDPYIATMNIQRAAARIDFMYKDGVNNTAAGELQYDVHQFPDDLSSRVLATVHVQNIIPVNLMQKPSYLIKRVTSNSSISSAVRYGSLETMNGAGIPNQYVIEPHTLLKEAAVADATLDSWYGTTRAKTVSDNINTYLTAATGITGYQATETTVSENVAGYTFDRNMTLAYTNENTQSKEHNDPNFMTGLLLKAIYEPKTVYSDASKTEVPYTKGTDFWRYSATFTTMAERYCKYFDNQAAAEAYRDAHPLEMGEVEYYPGGVCYYNIWLRHANIDTDPHLTFPMEYGIVRNNIYRVGVEKVTGPGTALPVMNGPDHIYLRIFVRKWNLRVQPAIRL